MSGASLPSWFEMRGGTGCPLCAPRPAVTPHSWHVCTLSLSSVYLWRNEAYRGTCTLVYDSGHITRPSELESSAWLQLCAEIRQVEAAITQLLRPAHVNVELMGNTVPHLHAWIIPRSASDPRWGGPIWTTAREEMALVPMSDADSEALAGEIAAAIAAAAPGRVAQR
jgi:diadenosine tetraphosphate (Ap4A) HIT family hydrolase